MISKTSSARKVAQLYLTARFMEDVLGKKKPADIDPIEIMSGADNLKEEMGFLFLDLVKMLPQWKEFERKLTAVASKHISDEKGFLKESLVHRRDLFSLSVKISEGDFARALGGRYDSEEVLEALEMTTKLKAQVDARVAEAQERAEARGKEIGDRAITEISEATTEAFIQKVYKVLFSIGKGAFGKIALDHIFESASRFSKRYKKNKSQEIKDFFAGRPLPRGVYSTLVNELDSEDTEEIVNDMMESFNERNLTDPPHFAREILERVEEGKDVMFDHLLDSLSDLKGRLVDEMRESFGGVLESKHEGVFRRMGFDALEGISERAVRERVEEAFEELMSPSYETLKVRAEEIRKEEKKQEKRRQKALMDSMRGQGAGEAVEHNTHMQRDEKEEEREALEEWFKDFQAKTQEEKKEIVEYNGGYRAFLRGLMSDFEEAEVSEKEMSELLRKALR